MDGGSFFSPITGIYLTRSQFWSLKVRKTIKESYLLSFYIFSQKYFAFKILPTYFCLILHVSNKLYCTFVCHELIFSKCSPPNTSSCLKKYKLCGFTSARAINTYCCHMLGHRNAASITVALKQEASELPSVLFRIKVGVIRLQTVVSPFSSS